MDPEEKKRSMALEQELNNDQREEDAIIKLLVLGTGESGKSTVFKQMKILYAEPDSPTKFIMIIRANLFSNCHAVVEGMKKLSIAFKSPDAETAAEYLLKKPADGNVDIEPDMPQKFVTVWADEGVQEAVLRANEFQLNDSTKYFWEAAERILKADYLPNEQDILRARVRTTGIVQQNFKVKGKRYTMFDVGGQRNERRKWIHCFDNVNAVIFVTAVSEYDQVLYEDENTNRMEEAIVLFEQICNHPSFKKTDMLLFLNKRDLFEEKLKRKDITCWDPTCTTGHDYDKTMDFIKGKFIAQNKDPSRTVYCHATCATDSNNVSFVMESVFQTILKENLKKMEKADVSKLMVAKGDGNSKVKHPPTYAKQTIVVNACWFVENLTERKVLTTGDVSKLPGVEMELGAIDAQSDEFTAIMALGANVPKLECSQIEKGTTMGNFKDACTSLRTLLNGTSELGSVYDMPVVSKTGVTFLNIVRKFKSLAEAQQATAGIKDMQWVTPEEMENAYAKVFDGDASAGFKPPSKGEEFDPFAPNPVGSRWFKGVQLFTANVQKQVEKGCYVAVLRVLSDPTGFKVMVNEHNRINIPMVFLTETQISGEELTWMQGVRVRESRKIDLLEGKQPNRGWLGPEMSGEEGATFPEKMWWAIDEMKSRLDSDSIGELYDAEVLNIDEQGQYQVVMYASIAKDEADLLPGHIWVDRSFLEVQNMKYLCASTLQNLLGELNGQVDKLNEVRFVLESGGDMAQMNKAREDKKKVIEDIQGLLESQKPLKWVNRVVTWCAEGMPSFAAKVENAGSMEPKAVVEAALKANPELAEIKAAREALIQKYCK
jgi:GTPase SAR1 family protein